MARWLWRVYAVAAVLALYVAVWFADASPIAFDGVLGVLEPHQRLADTMIRAFGLAKTNDNLAFLASAPALISAIIAFFAVILPLFVLEEVPRAPLKWRLFAFAMALIAFAALITFLYIITFSIPTGAWFVIAGLVGLGVLCAVIALSLSENGTATQ